MVIHILRFLNLITKKVNILNNQSEKQNIKIYPKHC